VRGIATEEEGKRGCHWTVDEDTSKPEGKGEKPPASSHDPQPTKKRER